MNGRKRDVLIESVTYTDQKTGVDTVSDRHFVVRADAGKKAIIKKVDGVTEVYDCQPTATKYDVFVDARYDIEFVKCEVEAAILCESEQS